MRLEWWLQEGLFCSSVGRPEYTSMQMAEEIREGRFGRGERKVRFWTSRDSLGYLSSWEGDEERTFGTTRPQKQGCL